MLHSLIRYAHWLSIAAFGLATAAGLHCGLMCVDRRNGMVMDCTFSRLTAQPCDTGMFILLLVFALAGLLAACATSLAEARWGR